MTEALRLGEAVELGYALVSRIADGCGVRLLGVKGPVLAAQGLRKPKESVDVDVLVAPGDYDRIRAELEVHGWRDEGVYDTPGIVPLHSVTHRHPLWPIEVDVHRWFPGFLGDPEVAFDALWERHGSVPMAHVEVQVPDRVGHTAVAALHYLRDAATQWGQGNLEDLAARVSTWDAEDLSALSELAARTGAAETLEPFLRQVGAPTVASSTPLVVSVDDWQTRADAETRQVLPWLVRLRKLPWHRRPGFVLWSVWLTDKHFRAWSDEPLTRWQVMQARFARLRRALRALPAARADLDRLMRRRGGGP